MTETDEPKPGQPDAEDAKIPEAGTVAPIETKAEGEGKALPWGALVGGVLVMLVAAGAVVTWPEWKGHVMPARVAAPDSATILSGGEIDVLRADLAQTRERLRQLEARLADRPAATSGSSVDLGPVENRLEQVEGAVQSLRSQPQVPARLVDEVETLGKQVADLRKTSADAAAVLRLADRVEKVEAEMREMQSRRTSATALLLAVGQLREAVNNAMPFDAEQRAVRALAPQDKDVAAALDGIKGRAVAGIPTRLALAQRFEALAPELVRAEALPAERTWWRQTLHRLSTLVTIRREDGDAAGTSAAATIARAQGRIGQGDTAGAVSELEKLEGGAAEAAAPWIEDARARVAADRALGELTAHVVAAIGPRQ